MKSRMTILALILLASVMTLGACQTWKGAGRDIERTGEKMQGHERDTTTAGSN